MARTCKKVYDLAIPFIYRDIYLETERTFTALIGALEHNRLNRYECEGIQGNDDRPRHRLRARQRLLNNFRLTRRVTIGDSPDGSYCARFAHALSRYDGLREYPILCPNSKLLRIAPLEAYLPGTEMWRMYTFAKSAPGFLEQLCCPRDICLYEIYGSEADFDRPIEDPRCLFSDLLFHDHLPQRAWGAGHKSSLSWHGPLLPSPMVHPLVPIDRYG